MAALALFVQTHIDVIAVSALAFVAGGACQRHVARWRWRKRAGSRYARPAWKPVSPIDKPKSFDAAEQLRQVERATFTSRNLLNRAESRLFGVLERACAAESPSWRVMAQVSLGEILASPDAEAYRAINSKRVDLLLVDEDGLPVHAVELQGSGHHLGPAATRDAIKKEALRKAGIGYVEVLSGDTPAEVRRLVAKLAARRRAA